MKEINIAMIGAGSIALTHSIGYATMPMHYWPCPAVPVRKVICDVRPEAAQEGAARFGWQEWATDWRNVVNRPDIDLVDIITPNAFHAEIAIAAAEAGKHVYCEKPLTGSSVEARRMCDAVVSSGVRTAVGFNKRRFPAVKWAKQLVESGYIGQPTYFHGQYFQSMNIDPEFPYCWRMDSGIIEEAGCHIMDICRYLIEDFDEVCAQTRVFIKERPRMVGFAVDTTKMVGDKNDMVPIVAEDFGTFFVRMKNGAMATFTSSNIASGNGDGCAFQLYGTRGAIKWEAKRGAELQISSANDPEDQKGFRTVEMGPEHPDCFWPFAGFGVNWSDLKAIEIHDFIDAIVNDKPFSADFDDARKIVDMTECIYESAKNGSKWVKVPV